MESQGEIKVRSRRAAPVQREFPTDDQVDPGSGAGAGGDSRLSKRRAQESELPAVVNLTYGEPANDDLSGAVEARRLAGAMSSSRTLDVALPVVMAQSWARARGRNALARCLGLARGWSLQLRPRRSRLIPAT